MQEKVEHDRGATVEAGRLHAPEQGRVRGLPRAVLGTIAASCGLALLGFGGVRLQAETIPVPPQLRAVYFEGAAPDGPAALRAMDAHQHKLAVFLRERTVGILVGGSQGSGVLVSPEGLVLTAAHVCIEANRRCLVILPDGRRVWARTLGLNRSRDAGLVRIEQPVRFLGEAPRRPDRLQESPDKSGTAAEREEGNGAGADAGEDESAKDARREGVGEGTSGGAYHFPYAEMAGAEGAIRPGQWCVATGHPGGYQPKRKPVVRLGRVLYVSDAIVRTDCALVGGDSGGPLCDMEGRVIGIHSRIGSPLHMNLHVPIGVFHASWDRLLKGEVWGEPPGSRARAPRPFLGVREGRGEGGAAVGEVVAGSAAESAGIRPGDVIVKYDGKPVADFDALVKLVARSKPGQEVVVEVRREGRIVQLRITLGAAEP